MHHFEHLPHKSHPYFPTENQTAAGDNRTDLRRVTTPSEEHKCRKLRRRIDNLIDRWLESIVNPGC